MDGVAVGIDIGGTKIKCALVNQKGEVLKESKYLTNVSGGYSAVLAQVIQYIKEMAFDLTSPLLGIGVGVAGQIELKTGLVLFAPNLKWNNTPLQKDLTEALSANVLVVNDVRAATWGEWRYGAGIGATDLVCIFVGTGIGGGIVTKGQMLEGYWNTGGEIGHAIVKMNGPLCGCGNHGCLEALASGSSIAKIAQEIISNDHTRGSFLLNMVDGQVKLITSYHIIEAFREGDPLAVEVMNGAIDALIAGLTGVVNILNPQKIILGGGVVEACPEIIESINVGIRKMSVKAATALVEISPTKLRNKAGVIGAASLIFK